MHYLGKESGNKNSVGPSGHEIVYVHVCTNVCVCVCVSGWGVGLSPRVAAALASPCFHGDVVFSDFWIGHLQLWFRTAPQVPSKDLQFGG